jgi:hypothetical protein
VDRRNAAHKAGLRAKASGAARQGWAGVRSLLRMSSMAKSKHGNQGPARAPMKLRETPGKCAGARRDSSMPRPAWEAAAGCLGVVPPEPQGRRLCLHV